MITTLGEAIGILIARRRRDRQIGASAPPLPLPPELLAPSEHDLVFDPPPRPSGEIVFGLPLRGRLTSPFGMRTHPISRKQKLHTGMDIASPRGEPIGAAAGGKVTFAGRKGGYGLTVMLRHEEGLESLYAHMDAISVEVNQDVEAGAQLGVVGMTGRTTGPHLHWEVRRDGEVIDPALVL